MATSNIENTTTPPHLPLGGAAGTTDKDWVRTSFMLPIVPGSPTVGKLNNDDKKWLYFSSAALKFTTTGLGGNIALNSPPKYTRFADIPTGMNMQGVVNTQALKTNTPLKNRMDIGGMGRYYSEAIDDNANLIWLRFGRPEYKGLITFFTGFYDVEASRLAREGRGSHLAFLAGRLVGTVAGLALLPVVLLYNLGKIFLGQPSTKYYINRPTMPLYWNRVNFIAERIAMSKGIIPKGKLLEKPGGSDFYAKHGMMLPGMEHENVKDFYTQLQSKRPQWFQSSDTFGGGLDIQAIIQTPNKIMADGQRRLEQIASTCNSPEEVEEKIMAQLVNNGFDKKVQVVGINSYLKGFFESRFGSLDYSKPDPFNEEIKNRLGQARAEWGLAGGPQLATAEDVVQTQAQVEAQSQQTRAIETTKAADAVNARVGGVGTTGILSSGVSSFVAGTEASGNESVTGTPTTPNAPGNQTTNSAAAGGSEQTKTQPNFNISIAKGSEQSGTGADYAQGGGSEYDKLAAQYASYDGQLFPVFVPTTDENTGQPSIVRSQPWTDAGDTINQIVGDKAQGQAWLILNVNTQETISESFSNNTSQSEIQSKINGLAAQNQAARFSLSDFNTGFGPIDAVIDTIKSTISGVASGLMLDGLVAMTGTGFVDIPERWDSASADISSSCSYTLNLRTPYGNTLSQFINIDIPIACMLAAALPISHGNQAYGEPFLVELYNPGKNIVRLGIITSLSITRGTGNMGWSQDGNPLGVDLTFTIKDLSTSVHAPIDPAASTLTPWKGLMAVDNTFHDYMSILGNMSIAEMTLNTGRFKLNVAQKISNYKRLISPARIEGVVWDTKIGRTIGRISQELGQVNESTR